MKKELLRMDHVSQKYNGELLLDNLNFYMFTGEIVGLISMHLKGHDRLIDLICHNHAISSGRVWYDDRIVNSYSFSDNSENKVCVIEQKSHLVETLSVVDNLFVLRKGFRKMYINDKVLKEQAGRFFDEKGIPLDIDKKVDSLTSLERCLLELSKALLWGYKLVIVDNPANFLSQHELLEFHKILRKVREDDVSILYVGNHHEEVFRIADRAALFYGGQVRKLFEQKEMRDENIAPYITDWQVQESVYVPEPEDGVMHFHSIYAGCLNSLRFVLHKGECLTLLDMDNQIADDILAVLTGKIVCRSGNITVEHEPYSLERAQRYLDAGIAIIPKNPVETLAFPEQSYMENLTFLLDRKLKRSLIPDKIYRSIRREYEPLVGPVIAKKKVRNLSWEEQLEMVYYRIQLYHPKILVCVQPLARGDMYCRRKILKLLGDMLKMGTAVLIITNTISDTLDISDRLVVVEGGSNTASYNKDEFYKFTR